MHIENETNNDTINLNRVLLDNYLDTLDDDDDLMFKHYAVYPPKKKEEDRFVIIGFVFLLFVILFSVINKC